jgi:hypothetical protein
MGVLILKKTSASLMIANTNALSKRRTKMTVAKEDPRKTYHAYPPWVKRIYYEKL